MSVQLNISTQDLSVKYRLTLNATGFFLMWRKSEYSQISHSSCLASQHR